MGSLRLTLRLRLLLMPGTHTTDILDTTDTLPTDTDTVLDTTATDGVDIMDTPTVDILDTTEARGQLRPNQNPLLLLRLILRLRLLLMPGTHTTEILDTTDTLVTTDTMPMDTVLDTTDTIWVDITHTPELIGVKQYQLKSRSLPFLSSF